MSRKFQNWAADDDDGEVDLTPMIDIVFLLIVFFMTVANMITAEKHPIEMPVALNSSIPEDYGDRTTITVDANGSIYSGVFLVTLDELRDTLAEASRENPSVRVYVRADSSTEHQYVNDVMQACAEAGLSNLIFAAYQSDK
tara:strand:+ start:5000 stop:5422 length:423 start_codon:yes stop_codon:yes gene_type:complete